MNTTDGLLATIAILLFIGVMKIWNIDERLKDRFPTEKEQDYRLAMEDPHGHWQAHKNDKRK